MSETVRIKKTDPSAKLPSKGHEGDAAHDVFANEAVTLNSGERAQVRTGLCMEIPEDYAIFIWDRSGLSHMHGLKTLGGVIDATYRGEVRVGMVNLGKEPYRIEKGDKVAQMVLQKIQHVSFMEVHELSETHRGEGGFGSTGK